MKFARSTAYTGRRGTEKHSGQIRFATAAQVQAGVANDVAVSPAHLGKGSDPISKYVVAADGSADYTTIQAAITDAAAAGIDAAIVCRPGVYTENLTLADGISIFGTSYTNTVITGLHTPPASGTIQIHNCTLTSATHIFSSAVAGTTDIYVTYCVTNATNGYLFNLDNWTGTLDVSQTGSVGTNDGFVNNTGGATIVVHSSRVGDGTGNAFVASGGTVDILSSEIACPGTFGGAATVTATMGSRFLGTITTADTATTTITDSSIATGANAAISHGSANALTLAQVTIDSAHATPIGGAGAGALDLGNVDFITNSVIAGTLTTTYMRATDRVSPYVVGPTGNYATIQAALDAADDSGIDQNVFVQAGAYTEDLTLYDGINIVGSGFTTTTITGTHTPPAAGTFQVHNCTLADADDIFNSAVAGTCDIEVSYCVTNCTNGFLFNLLNWTGALSVSQTGSAGTVDGFVNNTGGADITVHSSRVGAGAGAGVASGGTVYILSSEIECPITFGGAGAVDISHSNLFGLMTTADTATVLVGNTIFSTGANASIAHGSAGVMDLDNIVINSSNATPIGGAGAGVISIGHMSFDDGKGIANTLTIVYEAAVGRVSSYVVGASGSYATIQAGIDAAHASGIDQTVIVQAGAYTEALTLYDGIGILGNDPFETTITGVITPPAAGQVAVRGVTLASPTDIFNSAAAGTTDIIVQNCLVNATNGYLFNLLNWTGELNVDDVGSIGTTDGFVNNTGGADIFVTDATVGAGAGTYIASGGTVTLRAADINIAGLFGGAGVVDVLNTLFSGTVTTADTATLEVGNSSFSTGATAAISQGSAGVMSLSNCSITTSNNPAIDGAGAGVLTISGVEFLDGSNLAATLTLGYTAETRSTKLLCGDATYRVTTFTNEDGVIQAYATDGTATGAADRNAIEGNLTVTSGDGNHTPDAVQGTLFVASGSNVLTGFGVRGFCDQADGSVVASTLAGTEGHLNLLETDAADLPAVYAFGVKGYLDSTDSAGVPVGMCAGVGSVVEYNTPFNAKAYGFVASRLDAGGGAGTAGQAAYGVLQGTVAAADWLYGFDFGGVTNGFTTAEARFTNSSTIAADTEGVTFSGDISARKLIATNTSGTITSAPVMATKVDTGGVPTGATGDENLMVMQGGDIMEQHILGAGQTIIAPVMEADGLLISLDLINDEGVEYSWGFLASNKHAYTIGTSPAFYAEFELKIADVTGTDPLYIGFRKQEAYQGTFTVYTDYYLIGVEESQTTAVVTIADELNAGGTTYTNTTDAWTDGQTKKLRVLVSAAGVVTATIDGVAPSTPRAFTFDNGDVVMPCIYGLHGAGAPGKWHLVSRDVGFQAWT